MMLTPERTRKVSGGHEPLRVDEHDALVVTGFISHTFPDNKLNLFVSEVFYSDGQIVRGDFGPVERVPAGQEVRFELRSVAQIGFDVVELSVWSYHNS